MTWEKKVLIAVPNWLGDSVMAMPAVQVYHQINPTHRIEVLAKKGVAQLWKLHPSVSAVHLLDSSGKGAIESARELSKLSFDCSFILPHSFRAALVPWLGRIPNRTGLKGGGRSLLLSNKCQLPTSLESSHQAYEYLYVLAGNEDPTFSLPRPSLSISDESVSALKDRFCLVSGERIGLIPGAARGPSKQWPVEYYIELTKSIVAKRNAQLILIGTPDEKDLCEQISGEVGSRKVVNLAGQTSLAELPTLLRCCDLVACNDSGGMHLASAVGVAVVAFFGITDPSKTGPLGSRTRVLQLSEKRSKAIPRYSVEATEALARITPSMAMDAIEELLA